MAGGLALFWAVAFGLAQALGRGATSRALWLVVTLTGAEMARSIVLTGFPWALVGHVWIGTPQMQLAALGGADALTLLTLTAAALPAIFGARQLLLGAIAAAAVAASPGILTSLRVPSDPAPPIEPRQIVRLVQPNAAQHLKWRADMIPVFWQRKLALTAASPADASPAVDETRAIGSTPPDLVIWPETAIPSMLASAGPAFAEMAHAGGGATIAAGVQRRGESGGFHNSLAIVAPDGRLTAVYDKHHLVPFGEYMPLADLFARVGVFGLAARATGGYAPGPGPRLIDLGGAGRALPVICYEAIFARDIRDAPARPDWLMHVTNDAWFGQLAGPQQHLAQARLRAVEFGLPVLRAANTGISAAIDPYGRVVGAIPLGTAGALDTALPRALPAPPYARLGALPVLVALATLAMAAFIMTSRSGLEPRDPGQ
jgi:apolipoprotein N-acyltransferase